MLFSAIAMIAFAGSAFASNPVTPEKFQGEILVIETVQNEQSEFNVTFTDLESFNEFSSEQLNDLKADDECTASVSVTVTVSAGVISASVTLTAEGIPCKEVAAKIKELKKEATDALT